VSRRKKPRRTEKASRAEKAAPPLEPASDVLPASTASGLIMVGTIAATATLGVEIWLAGGRIGLPLDDAFIHLRFAENLARGDGFAFNPGESLPGSTSPLWVLLLSLPALLGANLLATAKILSAASLVLSALASARLAHRLTRRTEVAWMAGLGVLCAGRLLWAAGSGMETMAFAAVSLLAIERAMAPPGVSLGLLLGAGALLRPEGFLLSLLWLLVTTFRAEPPRLRLPAWRTLAAFAIVVTPWIVFCLVTTGAPFPTTFSAKRTFLERDPGWLFLARHVREIFESNPLLCLAYPVGVWFAARRARDPAWFLPLAWAIALPAAAAILLPVQYHHGRYLMPLLPLELCLGAVGLGWALDKLRTAEAVRRPIRRIAFVVILGGAGVGAVEYATKLGANVVEITQLHVRMGAWAKGATPSGALIAASDIGALGHVGDRRVLDLGGLVTPQAIPLIAGRRLGGGQDEALFPLIARERPAFLIVYPDWYPHLTARPDLFEPMALAKSDAQNIAGGRLLVAYRARWERYTPAPSLARAEADGRLEVARAAAREGRGEDAWRRLLELEARGPLDRAWRRSLYVARAEAALARGDCGSARESLVRLDWLTPPDAFRRREQVDALENRARACGNR
jgi:hypothetical protein